MAPARPRGGAHAQPICPPTDSKQLYDPGSPRAATAAEAHVLRDAATRWLLDHLDGRYGLYSDGEVTFEHVADAVAFKFAWGEEIAEVEAHNEGWIEDIKTRVGSALGSRRRPSSVGRSRGVCPAKTILGIRPRRSSTRLQHRAPAPLHLTGSECSGLFIKPGAGLMIRPSITPPKLITNRCRRPFRVLRGVDQHLRKHAVRVHVEQVAALYHVPVTVEPQVYV